MAMEKANHTKLVNLAIGETSSAAEEKIDQLTKKQQPQKYQHPQQYNQNNFGSPSNNQSQNCHYYCKKLQKDQQSKSNQRYSLPQQSYYQPPPLPQNQNSYYQPAPQPIQSQYQQSLLIQQYQTPLTQQYQIPNNNNRINPNNQLVLRNSGQQRPNHYHTQPSYLTMPEGSNFQQSALSEDEVAASRSNPSNNTIPPVQIAQNANLSNIFSFEFEANESLFLLSNTAANEQKAITAMYTEAIMKEKHIQLILDSRLAGSIIIYQLMQQLQRTVDRPAQTVIVTTDGMKKTPVGEINNFLFTIDEITILVKVLVMNTPQYQALKTEKAPVFEFEEEEELPVTETFMALGSPSNWAEETEQEIFEELRRWKKVRYFTPELWKQLPYILLKCKDCNKKLSSMGACIFSEEEYETHICYFCKACHRERFGYPKRSGKWDNTPCLTCKDMLPEECNWIDIAMRREVCDQTCQYALSISEKVRKRTPFDAAYNSAFNKLYYYSHNAKMIFDLAMALINRATQEDVCQIKKAEYIEYTMELAEFNYKEKVETYYQIASHIYPTQEAQI
ncbi:hypothetical protein G9A89_013704 [Geosiphon pyriformis]|nr:hypothetical protein G9A89_013704 [Geosiphon pyriformis]